MSYVVGQKVCLWQEEVTAEGVIVLKEVIVTITETKTGTPGEFSRNPVQNQSLCGIGDDGNIYKKHWDSWPESQTNNFIDQWSMRGDGEGEHCYWIPREAVFAHNALKDENRRNAGKGVVIKRTNTSGQGILPKGDVIYCEEHDEYYYPGGKCFECLCKERGVQRFNIQA